VSPFWRYTGAVFGLMGSVWGFLEVASLTWTDVVRAARASWEGFLAIRPAWSLFTIGCLLFAFWLLFRQKSPRIVIVAAEYELEFNDGTGADVTMRLYQKIRAYGATANAISSRFASATGTVPKDDIRLSADGEYEHQDRDDQFDWEGSDERGWTVTHRLAKALQPSCWPFRTTTLTRSGTVRFLNAFNDPEDFFRCKGFYTTRKLTLKVTFLTAHAPDPTNVWGEKILGHLVHKDKLKAPIHHGSKTTFTYEVYPLRDTNCEAAYRIFWRFRERMKSPPPRMLA
jgi:hypothetical protein